MDFDDVKKKPFFEWLNFCLKNEKKKHPCVGYRAKSGVRELG